MPNDSPIDYKDQEDRQILSQKLREYGTFIDETLYPNLQTAVQAQEEIESEIDEYQTLQDHLYILSQRTNTTNTTDTAIETKTTETETTAMVDLGEQQCYCPATISNLEWVYIHVGMGFHIQMSLGEAMEFCQKRMDFVSRDILVKRKERTKKIAQDLQSALIWMQQLQIEIRDDDDD